MKGLVEITPERDFDQTWVYRGFILNNWSDFFCFRPVKGWITRKMREWAQVQPESTSWRQGNDHHMVANDQKVKCLECQGGLDDCCRLIDRWWQAQGGKLTGWKAA